MLGVDMWGQADQSIIQLHEISSHGWKINDRVLAIDWDSDDNIK